MGQPALQIAIRPEEYFREKVVTALQSLKVEVNDEIEFYIVNLLCEFIDPKRLSSPGDGLSVLETPLAMMLKQAMEAPPTRKVKLYKGLGDTSLYFAGFFQDYFNNKTFDVSYYITLGTTAYNTIAALMRDVHRDEHFTAVYGALAQKFESLVEVVAEVSEQPGGKETSKDLLALYDRWTKSNSERLRRTLEKHGIMPTTTPTKIAQ
jgi:hypothetical protein